MRLLILFMLIGLAAQAQIALPQFKIENGKPIIGATALYHKDSMSDNKVPVLSLVNWMIQNTSPTTTINVAKPLGYDSVNKRIYVNIEVLVDTVSKALAGLAPISPVSRYHDTAYVRTVIEAMAAPLFVQGPQGIQGVPGPQGIPGTSGDAFFPEMTLLQIKALKPTKPMIVYCSTDGRYYWRNLKDNTWRYTTGTVLK